MKPYLTKIQTAIKTLAAEGRQKRNEARQTSHMERYHLKAEANEVGSDAREHLLAYHILRGRHPALSESPNTRWSNWSFPASSRVVALVGMHFEGSGVDRKALMGTALEYMTEWRMAVQSGTAADLQDRLRKEWTEKQAKQGEAA